MKTLLALSFILLGTLAPPEAKLYRPAHAATPIPGVTSTSQIRAYITTLNADAQVVPVPGATVRAAGLAAAVTDSRGSAALPQVAVPGDASQAPRVDIIVAAPGLGTFTYLSVALYPQNGPILTPTLTSTPQIDDLGSPVPPSRSAVTASTTLTPMSVSCSGWSSTNTPPNVIRVYHNGPHSPDYKIHTVDFRSYVSHVLPREWMPGWPTESLRSGAMAVKMWGWYTMVHPKHGTGGNCYDVDSSQNDQVWDPNLSYPWTDAAMNDTWDYYLMTTAGTPYDTQYTAGCNSGGRDLAPACYVPPTNGGDELCGYKDGLPAPGDTASQWGTQTCAAKPQNRVWYDILLNKYYFSPASMLVHGPVQTASPNERLPYFVPVVDPFADGLVRIHWSATPGVDYSICYDGYLGSFTGCSPIGNGVNETYQGIPAADFGEVYYRLQACQNGYCSAIMAGGVKNRIPNGNNFYGTASFVWPYAAAYVAEHNYSSSAKPVDLYDGVPGYGGFVEYHCPSVAPGTNCGPTTWAATNTDISWYVTVTQTQGTTVDTAPIRLYPRICVLGCTSGE